MSIRHVARTVAVSGAAVLCGALFLLAIDSGVAGALTSGDGFTTINPCSGCPFTGGVPYGDGQQIDVLVGANSSLNSTGQSANPTFNGNYYFEECADPQGTTANLPTSFNGCEAGTLDIEAGVASTGQAESPNFTVFKLPDPTAVGGPTMTNPPGASCGVAPNYCVIGIFGANPNSGNPGFSFPHLFSAPFQIRANQDGLVDGSNPGDGTPELSLAIGLPLAAIGIFGGFVLVRRRRGQQRQAA
jgi:hypothetical protein